MTDKKSGKCESYPRVMKYLKKRRPLKLIKKIEKDLLELKMLIGELSHEKNS